MILPGNQANTLPKIIYEEIEGTVSIKGRAISTEVEDYFSDFLPYFKDCLEKKPMNLRISIDLEYFNTTASKLLMEFLYIAKETEKRGFHVSVNWYYEEEDEDMLYTGEDYENLSKLKFNFISKAE